MIVRMSGLAGRLLRVLLCLVPFLAACSAPPDPITVDNGTVVVLNQTKKEWRNVVVTVNDHFRGGAPSIPPGGRMAAPLTQFQTAFGQHYDRSRQNVNKIELTATDADGQPVAIA